ncbi:MAG: hypothetical protein ACOYMN_14000, partial [Roseimicrobium sp.]
MTPDDEHDALYDEASGCVAVGDLAQAIGYYRQTVALDAEFFDGWHSLGMALLKAGDIKEAIGAGLMATTLRPN